MGIISIVAVAAVAGYNMYSSRSEIRLSDLALANVEAFAQNESNPNKQKCYRKWERHLLKMLWLYGIGYSRLRIILAIRGRAKK